MDKNLKTAQSTLCIGRDELINEVVIAARKHGAVLLFGGRQSGKTTLLRKLAEVLSVKKGSVGTLSSLDIPVFVDLMRLPVDATPVDFFSALITAAVAQCARQIDGFPSSYSYETELRGDPLTRFIFNLETLNRQCGEVDIHLLFLLDEAKRVLTDRFTRGFQDNLFALLYGEPELRPVRLSLVFAGAQHLYKLSEDSTSPIGTRAAPVTIKNLAKDDVLAYCRGSLGTDESNLEPYTDFIYDQTGGHAGLMTRFVDEFSGTANAPLDAEATIEVVLARNRGLLDNWIGSLTPEALCVAGSLSNVHNLSLGDVAQCLFNARLNQFSASRVVDELCYTGVALSLGKHVQPANRMFWTYFKSSLVAQSSEGMTHETWRLIEETELLLRDVVLQTYVSAFGQSALSTMRKILGDKTWEKILEIQEKSARQYRLSRQPDSRDIMSCMYIGDLQALIISNMAWANFKSRFRDKREFEDIIKSIAPVRNDRAHFSVVPEKELERCRIACDDLIVLFERTDNPGITE
ncbi:ATP-binding protein [Burkholderia gladioli]|uniref:ATP-binding protein n=1 Tax=Burkholderia gladioli TaxID=28095 RepID=UPI000FDAA3D6|nr:ATP-binding protein [Burkholderia gladioli]